MSERPRRYDPIAVSPESTVVAEYTPEPSTAASYQSEADLERELIRLLKSQAYEYAPITSEADLVVNLRAQLQALNGVEFSDSEWQRFFTARIAGAGDGIREKTTRIQEDHVQLLDRDDGSVKNISLIDKQNIHNNRLQVINQYAVGQGEGGAARSNRYDVTILVNGLPMVHIELKRRGVDLREAFNQINRYQRDSFWAGSGLFDYVQLFVISNGTLTKYYSNTTRRQHVEAASGSLRVRTSSNSFEFTSWWADARNVPIRDLTSFTKTFFAKHSLLSVLTRYCVLTVDRTLLVMRPYQIVATERLLHKIVTSVNYKTLGTVAAGGYVWHTTGSGKTLTSFKAAQLASRLSSVDKVLFVVDRKDLDYQTMREYDRFQKGAANGSESTADLKRQLENPDARIIVTTIQKLARFIGTHKGHTIYGGHVVLIFDECHRSQFGDMHTAITKAFTRYNIFGFTGTPIFAANAAGGTKPELRTTEQAFGEKLHTYTIVDAITDKNVLPFRIDYVNTLRVGDVVDKQVPGIDTEEALRSRERIGQIVAYTLDHFDQKTKRSEYYTVGEQRHRGFNALFAAASIDDARVYYNVFQHRQQHLPPDRRLKIAMIYSYGANDAADDLDVDDEALDASGLPSTAREALDDAIQDYNAMFDVAFDTGGDGFQGYYKDLSKRMKNREIDLLIVVNMFLTGFDATTLNTLFVDKNLRAHGLIQAFSRTNRILNSVKTYGNIVTFRDLEQETNDAIALFGNKDARGVVLLGPYRDYFADYAATVDTLLTSFPLDQPIIGEAAQKEFIALFGRFLRVRNILTSFDEFAGNEILTERQFQDYRSIYLELHAQYRPARDADKEKITDDIVFEIELVKQVEIGVDYILLLVQRHREQFGDGDDIRLRADISRGIDASPSLRNKKDLIEDFVDSVTVDGHIDQQWRAFIAERRETELEAIIAAENLHPEPTRRFMADAFETGRLSTDGLAITNLLPPMSRFAPDGSHGAKRQRVIDTLTDFFERYNGLIG